MRGVLRALAAAALGAPLALSAVTGSITASSSSVADAAEAAGGGRHTCKAWVALTFDDGPSYYRTQTLQTLRRKHVPATFFDVGMRVEANPQFAGFEAREGHLVLNHTWTHPHLPTLTPEQVRSQVLRTEDVLRKAGAPMPFRLVRPPYGDVDDAVAAQLESLRYEHITWDVVAPDWDVTTTSTQVRDIITSALRPGLVILMHDGPVDSAAGQADEVALPHIIDRARYRGYCFGVLDRDGDVVPARLRTSRAAIPEVINPVPYLPLEAYSGGQVPPEPYVIVPDAVEPGGRTP